MADNKEVEKAGVQNELNEQVDSKSETVESYKRTPKNFLIDMIKGMLMGMAFIIPGFSGGTVAVVLGVYNGFIHAITGLFKEFKRSFFYLLPFAIGIVVAIVALIFPIKLGFEFIPLPLISLFVGLMLGGMPPIIKDAGGKPKVTHILALVLAGAAAVGICFIPAISDSTLEGVGTYFALGGVGLLAACGCVVPGISGSMITMIFGYYDDVLGAASNIITFNEIGKNLLIVAVFGIGVIIGFFTIAFLMRFLLDRFKKGTYYAIIGFIIGSVFSIYYKQEMLINPDISTPLQIALAVFLFALGAISTYMFCVYVDKKSKKTELQDCSDNSTKNY